jgi:hypothetical protein
MEAQQAIEAIGGTLPARALLQFGAHPERRMAHERLPFTITVAHDEHRLDKAVSLRQAAYARHVPTLAQLLSRPEPVDTEPGSVVLLAESKLDGSALGTVRIQTNRYRKLAIEQSVRLPSRLRERRLAEPTRLGIVEGRIGRVVKTMLFKALYRYCRDAGVEWIVIGARAPLDRQYEALLFEDVFPGGGFVPLTHAGNIPHRVLAFEMESAEARWAEANHPLLGLFCRTHHPDIDLGEPRRARSDARALQEAFGHVTAGN